MQCPTQEFPSASSPKPDLEVMRSAQTAAIVANEKAFPVFAKKLASKDTKEFVGTTCKLTTWLASEKAYYPAARPKIVELLEIALSAFMDTFVHHPAFAEFAERLQQLVQAVIPFRNLFPEPELQSRLQRVIVDTERSLSTAAKRATHGYVPPQGAVTANTPSLPLISPVNAYSQPIMPPTSDSQKSILHIQPFSVPGAVKAVPDGSVRVDAPRARNSAEMASGKTDANLSLASPVTNAPQEPDGNISPSILSKPQPKRARKAELSEKLVARDLDWFKSNQASTIVNEDPSKAGESSPALMASDTTHIPGRSPSPKKKTARMVPSRRLPRRIPLDAQTVESTAFPPPSEPLAERMRSFENVEGVSIQNVNAQQPFLEKMQSDARSAAIPEAHDMQEVSPHEELPSPKLRLVATTSNELRIKPAIPQINHQSPSVQAPLLSGESTISLHLSTPLPDTTLDRMGSMDISASDIGSKGVLSETPRELGSTPPQSPEVLRLRSPILPPLVGAWEPPLNLNFNISRISSGHPQQSVIDANQRRFDGEMTVILSTQGKPLTHTHMIDLSLEESIFVKISKWVNRRSHPSEAPHGVCISLACYRLPEFFDKIKSESGESDIEALTSQSSCSWPYSNRLSLHVNDETRHTIITLSPPLFLTPDQCVDISSLMKPGNNTLEIRQQGDLSQYLVVLHAHHPTRAQLSELGVVKIADERWRQFLDVLSAQVVPGKVLGTTPAGVVGVF